MKIIKNILKWLIIVIVVLCTGLYITGYGYLITAVKTIYFNGHATAFLDDYKEFDNHTIPPSTTPQPWPNHSDYNKAKPTTELNNLNTDFETIAFMIIKNDSIWYESYTDGFGTSSQTNSFSMAKTMVSAMLGNAIETGKIKNLDEPVIHYIPELEGNYAKEVTVGDLASMASGLDWDEDYYSPFSITTRAYFDTDLQRMMLEVPVAYEPGKAYKYLSGNTQLLGMVLTKATGKTLAENIYETLWNPLGAENPALWQVDSDKNGMEKAYCCVASNARDFARIGKLYKDDGIWNGKRILPEGFVQKSIYPRFNDSPEYGYGLWLLDRNNKHFFMMRGHLGQYVIVQPEDNVIIVRLGHHTPKQDRSIPKEERDPFTYDIYGYIDEAYKMMNYAEEDKP